MNVCVIVVIYNVCGSNVVFAVVGVLKLLIYLVCLLVVLIIVTVDFALIVCVIYVTGVVVDVVPASIFIAERELVQLVGGFALECVCSYQGI